MTTELINSTKIVSGKIFSKYALDAEMKGLKRERKTNKKEKNKKEKRKKEEKNKIRLS